MNKKLFLILAATFVAGSIPSANAGKFIEIENLGTGLVDTATAGGSTTINATVIVKDLHLKRDKTYIIGKNTIIKAGVRVTVDCGTLIRCEYPTINSSSGILPSDPGALLAHRGGQLVMNGTAEAPIIVTTMDDINVPGGADTVPALANRGVSGSANGILGNEKVYKDIVTAGNLVSGSVGSGSYTLKDGLPVLGGLSYSTDPTVTGNIFSIDGKYGGLVLAGRANLGARMPTTTVVNNARTGKQADGTGGGTSNPSTAAARGAEQIEGMAGYTGYTWYGGDDDLDSSGKIRYVQTRFGGYVIASSKELNGFTWCAAGTRTVSDFTECFGNADDDNEYFGGSVGSKYSVDAYSGDDGHDIDQGHCGVHQFVLQVQNSCDVAGISTRVDSAAGEFGASGKKVENAGDQVNEVDGPENIDYTAGPGGPLSVFTLANFTGIGRGYGPSGWVRPMGGVGGIPLDGPNCKDNASGKFWNALYMDIPHAGPVFAAQSAASVLTSNQTDTHWHLQNTRQTGGYDNAGVADDLVTAMTGGPGEPDLLFRNCVWFRTGLAQPVLKATGANDTGGFAFGKYSTKSAFEAAKTLGNANYDANWWVASRANICPVTTLNNNDRTAKAAVVCQVNGNSASSSIVSNATLNLDSATTDTTTGNSFNLDPGYEVPIDNRTSAACLDLRLGANSTAARTTTVALPTRGNLNPNANFIGAFKDSNWARGWTMMERAGVFKGTVGNTQIAPVLIVSVDGSGQPVLSFDTQSDKKYSVEASVDDNHYRPLATVTGNGSVKSYTVSTGLNASATQTAPYVSGDIVNAAFDAGKRTSDASTFAAIPSTVSSQPILFRVIAF